ncbi:ferredoxin hydrogenase [Eubacterium multiforme]|uniref:Iron-only hydrogenase group A n=1 Tax=Eubacterium multiforme TaxID=83339 RepID=A0ABT9UNN3_9FIRM|nr:ferredoxin hydrogenase [Eubacterium multiforme]MDQ0148254.1 iron-only hydrogenase group A [Eubacterium multiforme]
MDCVIINGKKVLAEKGETILSVAKKNGIDIPTLCFLEDCNNMGNCGVCLVEVEGEKDLVKACSYKVKEGDIINTANERVQKAVKERVSEILNDHNLKCGKCKRLKDCELLKLVIKVNGKKSENFNIDEEKYIDDRSKSIVIDRSKCIKCGRCVAACREKIGTKIMDFRTNNNEVVVGPEKLACFDDTNCLLCGQCVAACPVGALSEKSHIEIVEDALKDKDKHVIVGIAPSVRTAVGEAFGMGYGKDVTGKIYAALRGLGFKKVFDVNFAADVTIMEEGTELIGRIKNNGPFPMFTSCCPGWIRLVENYYPQLLNNISSAKSPQQIFGAASKSYYPHIEDIDPKKVFTVSIMPCTAKKFEASREEMVNKDGIRDIDAVLTTRELAQLIKKNNIDFINLEDEDADPAMGEYTGAGTIFGATGGVMEAALRTAKDLMEGAALEDVDYKEVRGLEGIKDATIKISGADYKVAVIHGGENLFKFINSGMMDKGNYHFIEVMACPGGCVNGGGQPHVSSIDRENIDIKKIRASVLYNQDENLSKRKSHKNKSVLKMYETYIGEPNTGKAHELFHVKYRK